MRYLFVIAVVVFSVVACDDENTTDVDGGGGSGGEHSDGEVDAAGEDATVLPDASLFDARPDLPVADAAPDLSIPDARPDGALPDVRLPDVGPAGPARLRHGRLHWTAGPAGRGSAPMRFSGHGLKVEGRLRALLTSSWVPDTPNADRTDLNGRLSGGKQGGRLVAPVPSRARTSTGRSWRGRRRA